MGVHISLTIPQDPEMILLQLTGQGGSAAEPSQLQPAKAALQEELLAERRLCQSDVLGEGIRSSGNGCRISLEHKQAFSWPGISRSWHISLCRSWEVWMSCVHRWCSGCQSCSCVQSQNSYPSKHAKPLPTFFQSLFPFPLLHPEIPLAIKVPSISVKRGCESRAINKGKPRVHLENCQFNSEWEADFL